MNKLLKYLQRLDLVLSLASLAWGFFAPSIWALMGGCLGLVVTWYNPSARLQAYLKKRFLRKAPGPSDAGALLEEDALYAQAELEEPLAEASAAQAPAAPTYDAGPLPAVAYLHPSKHNWLSAQSLAGRTPAAGATTWA